MRLEPVQELHVRRACEDHGARLAAARIEERILILNVEAPLPDLPALNALGRSLQEAGFRWVSLELEPEVSL